jgi:hypothetical protein
MVAELMRKQWQEKDTWVSEHVNFDQKWEPREGINTNMAFVATCGRHQVREWCNWWYNKCSSRKKIMTNFPSFLKLHGRQVT